MEEETKTQRGYVSRPGLCQTNRHVTGAHTLYCYATSKTEGKKKEREKRYGANAVLQKGGCGRPKFAEEQGELEIRDIPKIESTWICYYLL